jgi:hypothetical protein
MPVKHTKISGSHSNPPSPPSPPAADKKIHTAGLGFVLLILTNYQAEVKQVIQAILKWAT